MNNPRISVITVCYNAIDTIEKTILSVINQTYSNIEYIIIDGGSSDGTVDVIKKYESSITNWISERDKGIYDAMNKGIKMATGEWIHFRNSGDIFDSPSSIEELFSDSVLDDVCVLHGDCKFVCEFGEIIRKPFIELEGFSTINMPVHHPSAFIRLNYQRVHLYDIKYKSSADYNFFMDCINDNVRFKYCPIIVSRYSYGDGISVVNWSVVAKENREILQRHGKIVSSEFKFALVNINTLIRNCLKRILPSYIVKKIILRNLVKEGWTIY